MAARQGLGTLVGAAIVAPIVYALVRLRRHAPEAASTADLVGSTLGPRGATFAGTLQVTGYVLVAVTAAQLFGLAWTPLSASDDPFGPVHTNDWLWSLWAVAAIVGAAVLVFAVPGRILAGLAAVLALGGLLVQFYYGLAVIARGLTGTVSDPNVGAAVAAQVNGLASAGMLAVAAVTLAGFEVVTTRTRRASTNGWPMSLAIAFVALVAVVGWWACQFSGYGEGSVDGASFGMVVDDVYGGTGVQVVGVGTAMFAFAALLALLWGVGAVIDGLDVRAPSDAIFGGVVLAMVLLSIALIHGGWTLGYVGGLVLFALYAVVLVASARISADSVVTWWLRIVMPVVLVALVLLPLAWAEFSPGSLAPVVIAALLIAAAGAVAVVVAGAVAVAVAGTRSRAD